MCEYCKPLKSCPVGEKRRAVLNRDIPNGKLEIVLNRYEGFSIGILHAEYRQSVYKKKLLFAGYAEGGFWKNMSIQIQYCPVCGEKLADDVLREDDIFPTPFK